MAVSILLYGCTTWTPIVSKSRKQHPVKQQLYGYLPPISQTIQVRQTRYARHCWRNKDELLSDVLLCNATYGRASDDQPARTYLHKFCMDTGYSLENLPGAMEDGDDQREREREREKETERERERERKIQGNLFWQHDLIMMEMTVPLPIWNPIAQNYLC